MNIDLILALAKAGISDEQIKAVAVTLDAEPAPEPQPVPEPAPHPVPEPQPATPASTAQAADPAGLESLLHDVLDSVQGLRQTVQASQVLTGYQAQPASREDALKTAMMHATGNFIPPETK